MSEGIINLSITGGGRQGVQQKGGRAWKKARMRRKDAECWLMRFLEPLSAASTPAAMVRVQTCLPTQRKP